MIFPSRDHVSRFQKRLARIKQNDPYVTELDMDHEDYFHSRTEDDVIALGSSLQKSVHVNRVCLEISKLSTLEGCSTMEEYLKVTKSLRQFTILPTIPPDGQTHTRAYISKKQILWEKIIDRLLLALQDNTCLRELTLLSPHFSSQSLSQYLSTTHSLQVLRLANIDDYTGSNRDATVISKAIHQCHTIKRITFFNLSDSWMVSILQCGLKNHPTLELLSLQGMEPDDFTSAVAVALQQVLESSTPLRSLQFHHCKLSRLELKPIVQGLMQHPTVYSLHIENCQIPEDVAIQTLKELVESSHEKLQSLSFRDSDFCESMFHSLQQNTCIKYLNLGGEYDQDEDTLPLVETIIRSNPRLIHLFLEENDITDDESFVSFMKTVLYDSSLRVLDCGYVEDLDDPFKDLACWPIPQNPPNKECMLRELYLSANLTEEGMHHFVTFLQVHTPRLRSLSLSCHRFSYKKAMHFVEWLAKSSLVELCLRLDMLALREIFAMLRNDHSTLKHVVFELDVFNVF
jgi:hypothetical protein